MGDPSSLSASRRGLAMALAAAWLASAATGCDKLKSLSGSASAEAEESASAEESADSDEASPKKKGKGKKKKAAKAADTAPVPVVPPPPTVAPTPPAPTTPPAPALDYFVDATSIPRKLKDKLGPTLRVYELNIYPTYSFAKLQDPRQPLHVDQYELRNGEVGPPTPVKFVGKEPTEVELKNVTFDLDEVDWAQVPQMVTDAPKRLAKIEEPSVTHISLKRPVPFTTEVRFRLFVDGPRAGGSVEYDAHGVMRKVYE
jgi:hypothetical protein